MFNMRIFQRNEWWHIEYDRNRSISLKTKDEKVAIAALLDMEEEALRGRLLLLDKRERVSISQFILIYTQDPDRSELSSKTLEGDNTAFQRLIDVAGDIPLKLVTKDTIKEFKSTLLLRMKKVSINSYLTEFIISGFLFVVRYSIQLSYRRTNNPEHIPRFFKNFKFYCF